MSDVMYNFLECMSIFENSDLKYKSIILFFFLSVLILSHGMFVVMMKIVASLQKK
jgi:hypothetical protein